jgi:competence protein ComEC
MFRKYPSLCLLAGVAAGILLADTFRIPAWVFMIFCLALGSAAILTLAARRRLLFAFLCIGTFLCFAALRFALSYYDLSANNVIRYADGSHNYRLFGTVSDWPRLKPELTEIRLSLDSLVAQRSLPVRGTVLLKITDTTTAIQRGDRLECYGRIYPVKAGGSGSNFNYQRFLRLKGISGTVYLPTLLDVRIDRRNRYSFFAFIDRLRSAIRSSFYRNLTPEAAALATGFLIGETRDIPVDLYQRFRESGTLHLLAVSGSNVALILVSVVALLRPFRIRRKPRAFLLMAIVVIFSFLSYGEPSVLRAAVMAGLVLGANVLERKYDLNNVIALAGLIILLADPSQLFDVGFQLSFVIAWGLIFILPKVTGLLSAHHNKRWYRYLVFPLLVSLTAQICATGLIALYFQQVPVLSPAANLIVVPLVSVVVVGSLVLLLADLVLPILGLMLGSWLNVVLIAVIRSVQLFGAEGTPSLRFESVPETYVVVFYLLLALSAASITSRYLRRVAVTSFAVVVNAVLILLVVHHLKEKPRAELYCFTVPGGIAATVQSRGNESVDLVLLNLRQAKYRIDEKVLDPALKSVGVHSIKRLFLLSSEYGALDDVGRLASAYSVDTVFVAQVLMPSLREVFTRDSVLAESTRIMAFSDLFSARADRGYFTFADGLALRGEQGLVVFSNGVDLPEQVRAVEDRSAVLVLGQTWSLGGEAVRALRERGINSIVCSKIEQPDIPVEEWETEVHQLYSEGRLKLAL